MGRQSAVTFWNVTANAVTAQLKIIHCSRTFLHNIDKSSVEKLIRTYKKTFTDHLFQDENVLNCLLF